MYKECSTNECNVNPGQDPRCESRVIDAITLGECDNKCYTPFGRPGPVVIKAPVVLSEVKIQIDVEADIRLEEPAFDIKTIDKRVCITQCHLVPHTNKLFISGFVQKNIQYSTVECTSKTSISGNIAHSTLNIPFKCVTAIKFDKKPMLGKSSKSKSNTLDKGMHCEDNNQESWMHFNKPHERIFCELEWSNIFETDIFDRDINCTGSFSREKCFQDIIEKMVVYVKIKVLQNQQVYISEPDCKFEMIEECGCNEKEYDRELEIGYFADKGVLGRPMGEEEY